MYEGMNGSGGGGDSMCNDVNKDLFQHIYACMWVYLWVEVDV